MRAVPRTRRDLPCRRVIIEECTEEAFFEHMTTMHEDQIMSGGLFGAIVAG